MTDRNRNIPRTWRWALAAALLLLTAGSAQAVRIKDICGIEGVRENQLVGYGLVVGLKGSGDDKGTGFTIQSLASFMRKHSIQINPKDIDVKNVAAVMVTAKLPPFARQGMKVDAMVSAMGSADNLQGGTLIATPLMPPSATGKSPQDIYAVAQGTISTGGYAAAQGQASVVKNHPTVALIPDGAIIEREVRTAFATKPEIQLLLRNPDFTTAVRIAQIINASAGTTCAAPRDATAVTVKMPAGGGDERVRFVAQIEALEVSPDAPARVVYNERTGTIVMGGNVRISSAIITHGNLVFEKKEPTSTALVTTRDRAGSQDVLLENRDPEVRVREESGEFRVLDEGVTIGEVARGLNALGVSARDIISILQALKQCGALQAELASM